jgi:hypothetical protein
MPAVTPSAVRVGEAALRATIDALRSAGARQLEGIVLWLGRRSAGEIEVQEAYVPEHAAGPRHFHIPPLGMVALLERLAETGTLVAAQVHSHPFEAFHSDADDDHAVVRHVGALSIVLPDFAQRTSPASFLADAAVFMLDRRNVWSEVPRQDVARLILLR